MAAESSTAKYGVKLDVVEPGDVLRTTEGRTYQLGSDVGYVVRVPAGWLYGPVDGVVNLLRPDGSSPLHALIEQAGLDMPAAPAVSADGRRIAWAKGDAVLTGILTPAGMTEMREQSRPNRHISRDVDRVAGRVGAAVRAWLLWLPKGAVRRVGSVPGQLRSTVDARGMAGLWPDAHAALRDQRTDATGNGCLVQLNGVRDLSVTARACVPGA